MKQAVVVVRSCLAFVLLLGMLHGFTPALASPMDKLVAFYTSPMPNPPQVPIDIGKVVALADTGDIIIENNRAFPQWAAMIGVLVPQTRFVHSGMVIKGHVLKEINRKFGSMVGAREGFTVYRRRRCPETRNGQSVFVWRWKAQPEIHYGRRYVITPEVVESESMSRVVALDLEDYLRDPAVGYSCKHIKLLRPKIDGQLALDRVSRYLGYHLLKRTEYDMGFDITEIEKAVRRLENGDIEFDLSIMPVPLYCTELVLRALREATLEVATTFINRKAAAVAQRIPGLPAMMTEKLKAPFITADCFIPDTQVLYENEPAPTAGQLLKLMTHRAFRQMCENLSARFGAIADQTQRSRSQ